MRRVFFLLFAVLSMCVLPCLSQTQGATYVPYSFTNVIWISPPDGFHADAELIPRGPASCNVWARLTALCADNSGDSDNELIWGKIDPEQCKIESEEEEIYPSDTYSEEQNFTGVNLDFYNPAMWVEHDDYDLPGSEGMFFEIVTYTVRINDSDRPDE